MKIYEGSKALAPTPGSPSKPRASVPFSSITRREPPRAPPQGSWKTARLGVWGFVLLSNQYPVPGCIAGDTDLVDVLRRSQPGRSAEGIQGA